MRSLQQQFDDSIAEVYAEDKRQREILMRFLSDYQKQEQLIDYVMERLAEDAFKMGDDAKDFFCRCADEVFKINLKIAAEKGGKRPESIKKLHPLFGEPWWTT